MKFTFNWLKEFVSYSGAPEELAKSLTMAGLEVESLVPLGASDNQGDDWVFEIAVTPNRGDCLGLLGLAREVAALTGASAKPLMVSAHSRANLKKRISVSIEDDSLCARYSARIVDGLRIEAAPAWMRSRLEACGIRSINNIVDVTNYVMLETGQPLHAFDLDRLPYPAINARPAREIGKFITLDGVERELLNQDLLICAGDKPVALAGIMGGLDSEVHAQTRSTLLESANFDPISIRRTAKRLGLHSEASHRFERGVDPEGTLTALDRAVYWLEQGGAGVAVPGVVDSYPRKPHLSAVTLRDERVERLLGIPVAPKTAETLLGALGLKTQRQKRAIKVTRSPRRPDLSREADLIEELARLQGYDQIPTVLPRLRPSTGTDLRLHWERRVRYFLEGSGLLEVINLPFVNEELNGIFPGLWSGPSKPVTILNPLAKESAEMRLSLIPGLIVNLQTNVAQSSDSFHAFHLGKVFRQGSGAAEERTYFAGLLYGPRARHGLRDKQNSPLDFLAAKGLVEGILDLFHLHTPVGWDRAAESWLHPGRGALLSIEGKRLGCVGQLQPELSERFGVSTCVAFELDFEELLQYAPRQITAQPLPRFPSVERDFAVVVNRDFTAQQIVGWIENLGEALIEQVDVFDQYLGAPIPEGKKSLAYKILYRAEDRTLTDTEVNALHQTLVERIGNIFGAERR